MAIVTRCPNGHSVRAKDEHAGRTGFCPRCNVKMQVPIPQPAGNLGVSGEFVRQDPRPAWDAGETGPAATSSPFPVKQKTKLCVGCGNNVSQSFTVCPRCGTPLGKYRHLDVQREDGHIVVRFVERQLRDERIIGEIAEGLCGIADRVPQPHLVLDFARVAGVSSMMLGKLLMLQTKIRNGRGKLALRNVGPEVRQILAATRLDHTFHIEEDEASALKPSA